MKTDYFNRQIVQRCDIFHSLSTYCLLSSIFFQTIIFIKTQRNVTFAMRVSVREFFAH